MAHQLVDSMKVPGKVLMLYRSFEGNSLPWHRLGKGAEKWTTDEVKDFLEVETEVNVKDLYAEDFRVPDRRAVFWGERYLGTIGPDTVILQNNDFFENLRGWETNGYEIETAGYLRGGSRAWFQVHIPHDKDEFTVRDGDRIAPYFFMAHAHDGSLSLASGMVQTRIVCNNTLSISLKEEGVSKRKHTGNVIMKVSEINHAARKVLDAAKKHVQQYRFLDSVEVPDKEQDILRFAEAFAKDMKGKDLEVVAKSKILEPGRVHEDIVARFMGGIGSEAKTCWDLFNAVTERNSHSLGNAMADESDGDRIARRFDNSMFGGQRDIAKALRVATDMAKLWAA